jgi:hypothetical protein
MKTSKYRPQSTLSENMSVMTVEHLFFEDIFYAMNFEICFMFISNGLTLFVVCLNITVHLLVFVQMCETLVHSHACVILLWIDFDVIM